MTVNEAFMAFEIDELQSENRSPKTIANYQNACNSFVKSIGQDIPIQLVGYNHIIEWKKAMYDSGIATSHLAKQLLLLRRILTYLKSHGFETLSADEIKIPKYANKAPTWLSVDEVGIFLNSITKTRDRALFAALFSSGARISELLQLNRDSIVNGQAEIIGKGNKKGTLEFDKNALKLINEYLEERTDKTEPLFVSNQLRRIHVTRVIQLAHEYQKLAGLDKNITPHVFRHSFATNLKLNGMDIYDLSKQLRHSKITTTMIYTHVGQEEKQDNYNKFHTPTPI